MKTEFIKHYVQKQSIYHESYNIRTHLAYIANGKK